MENRIRPENLTVGQLEDFLAKVENKDLPIIVNEGRWYRPYGVDETKKAVEIYL